MPRVGRSHATVCGSVTEPDRTKVAKGFLGRIKSEPSPHHVETRGGATPTSMRCVHSLHHSHIRLYVRVWAALAGLVAVVAAGVGSTLLPMKSPPPNAVGDVADGTTTRCGDATMKPRPDFVGGAVKPNHSGWYVAPQPISMPVAESIGSLMAPFRKACKVRARS